MSSGIQHLVGGLSVAILLVLVVLMYGYPASTTDEHEEKAPFGDDTKLFWTLFVGLTVAVLLVVLAVGFLSAPTVPAGRPVMVVSSDGSSLPSAFSTASHRTSSFSDLSDLSSLSSLSSLGSLGSLSSLSDFSTLDSFSSSDISTSLGALSDSLSSSVTQSI